MLSGFANATVSGKPIVFDDAVDLGVQLLMAGLDTVAALFGFVMHFLARHPAHCKELVDDPSLIPGAADEFLRRFGMVTNAREVVEDYEFYGVRLAKGDIISAPTFIYGMDEREFEDPMSINFRRSAGEHTTFGHGRHRCPGSFLARAELRITLEEWLARIPEFRVDVDQPVHMHAGISGGLDQLHLRWD
jgi:cytochrome P450